MGSSSSKGLTEGEKQLRTTMGEGKKAHSARQGDISSSPSLLRVRRTLLCNVQMPPHGTKGQQSCKPMVPSPLH